MAKKQQQKKTGGKPLYIEKVGTTREELKAAAISMSTQILGREPTQEELDEVDRMLEERYPDD